MISGFKVWDRSCSEPSEVGGVRVSCSCKGSGGGAIKNEEGTNDSASLMWSSNGSCHCRDDLDLLVCACSARLGKNFYTISFVLDLFVSDTIANNDD